MDWKNLFLSADGRIGRQEFWIGWLVLFAIGILLGWIIPIIGLILLYPQICIYSKRLHDMGKSGWLQLIPYVVFFLAILVGVFTVGGSAITAAMSGASDEATAASALMGAGVFVLLLLGAGLVGFVFLLWVGLSGPEQADNKYGPYVPKGSTTPTVTPGA